MLEITDTSWPRFELAMERLRAGHAIRFRDVTFFVGQDAHLEISINSSCAPENVTEQKALEELERAQNTYRNLCGDSAAFDTAFRNNTPRFILSDDYGTGSVELARLRDRKLFGRSDLLRHRCEYPDLCGGTFAVTEASNR